MEPLLDKALCDSMYRTLNKTNVFKYNAELKAHHSQVCAVLDRLRYAVRWINNHQEAPQGKNASIGLMTFMMFASEIKSSIEGLRKDFKLTSTLFDSGHSDSRKFFKSVCQSDPLNISSDKCPTDDDFFQYFRSLVFAHSTKVDRPNFMLLSNEIQSCPFIINRSLKKYHDEPDDYVGVMIYSTEKYRDGKVLRVRFSDLKAYLKSRYDSLRLVLDKIKKIIKQSSKTWKLVKVDESLSPVDQLKFMCDKFQERCDDACKYEVQQIIDILESPCSLPENSDRVEMFRKEIISAVPQLVTCFRNLDRDTLHSIVYRFTDNGIDSSGENEYSLEKIFEYLDDPKNHDWAEVHIEMVAKDFIGKWVKIDQQLMSDKEIKMLITLSCYYEYGKCKSVGD